MPKARITVTIDPQVKEATEQEAGRLRVSVSWLTDTALRELLSRKRKRRVIEDGRQKSA